MIELRAYNTKCGVWKYFTVNDGQISLGRKRLSCDRDIESYAEMRRYFEVRK